ncbi:MAG: terminase large subunit [Truepera sp.]|nr:terminase large subunit [Truepera sp.]
MTKTDLIAFLRRLTVTQGSRAGRRLALLDWEKRFIRGAFAPGATTAALSLGRGNGKTTLTAAIGAAAVVGPLAQPRAECIAVASSFAQARIIFEHCRAFLRPWIAEDKRRYRVVDSTAAAFIEDRETGARFRAVGSDPKRVHGVAPSLILADEPAQWPGGTSDAMISALLTSLSKIPGSRLVALGTRPADDFHWFSEMLAGGADFILCYSAPSDAAPFDPETWRMANPSLAAFPDLRRAIERESERSTANPALMASFKALRLNMGIPDVIEALLIESDAWRACEVSELPPAEGPAVWGIDLGATAAMSAIAAYWPATGRLEMVAAFPGVPDLEARGRRDAVGGLYTDMAGRGELIQVGRNTVSVPELLEEALGRWGPPSAIACDRWRQGELLDALGGSPIPLCEVVWRGQGFKDGAEDVRGFRAAVLERRVAVRPSLLLRAALAEARTVSDPAGNAKLAKNVQGGRRSRGRDDAAAAAILAIALGGRLPTPDPVADRPRYLIAG